MSQVRGHVHEVGETQQITESFKKRELILLIADNPQYPQYVKFDTNQDKVNLLDGLKVGQEVELDYNLQGRPWTNKEGVTTYFNTLVAWKITKIGTAPQATQNNPYDMPPVTSGSDDDDDLPF